MIYIFWTTNSENEAKSIITSLLDKKWIGCANMIPHIKSLYLWKGKVEEDQEVKVILKTKEPYFKRIKEHIETMCSYDVPEIVMIKVANCSKKYAQWLDEQLS